MRKQWCHNHKTWISDNWKRLHVMVRWVIFHVVPYIRRSLHLKNTRGSLQSRIHCSNSETLVRFCVGLVSNIMVTFHGQFLQGTMWTGWIIRYIVGSKGYFQRTAEFFKVKMSSFTQLELFSYGLKSIKMDLNIIHGQYNHQSWTTLNHSSVLETRVRNRFPPPTSLKSTSSRGMV
jgi:hypothetical protein